MRNSAVKRCVFLGAFTLACSQELWLTAIALGSLFGLYLAFSLSGFVKALTNAIEGKPALIFALAAALLFPYLAYSLPLGLFSLRDLVVLAIYISFPCGCLLFRRKGGGLTVQDAFAILALWLPFEFGWLPEISLPLPGEMTIPMQLLIAINLGFYLFLVVRPLPEIGYTFRIKRDEMILALASFLAFAAIAIPIGLATGFIAFSPKLHSALKILGTTVSILFAIGIPEELLFRGIIHNLIQRRLGAKKVWMALTISSLIFGAAHLNDPSPDWRYFLLATIAGVFYGFAYIRTKKITVAAIVHTLVDAVWKLYFS
jgi:hypothetical protein